MRKAVLLLLCLLAGLTPFSHAEGFPILPDSTEAPEFSPSPAEGMSLTADGEVFALQFDISPLYSMRQNGYIQCSFYGYSGSRLCEIFLVIPDSVQAGDILTSQNRAQAGDDESGILMSMTDETSTVISCATQSAEGAFPSQSAYTLRLDSVYAFDGMITLSGTMEATLVEVDEQYSVLGTPHAVSATFSCTLGTGMTPDETPAPEANATTPPVLVPPSDARKI